MDQDICWDNVDVLTHSDNEPDVKANLGGRIEHVTIGEKIYIPKRSYMKYVKPWHIAASVGLIVFVIIILAITIKGRSAVSKEKESWNNFQSGLIIIHNNSLLGYDPRLKEMISVLKTDNYIGAFSITANKTILWNEFNRSRIVSSKNSAQLNNLNSSIFDEPRFNPHAMAVDTFTEKLYSIDKSSGTLIVIDLQTKQYGIALTDLKDPHEIHLDPAQGVIFILQFSHSILRVNMDGSDLIKITNHGNYSAFTLDCKSKKVYWIKDFFKIERADYNGYRIELVLTDHVRIISLAIFNEQLFWLWPANGPHNASLWSCRLTNETCKSHRMELANLYNATLIKAYTERNETVSENSCLMHNGGCQQMCVLSSGSNAGRSCACQVGMELGLDSRTCQNASVFIVYTLGNYVRGRILDASRVPFSDVFLPVRFYTMALSYKTAIDFDYDMRNDEFYFSDDRNIYKMSLKRPGNQTIVQTCPDSHVFEDLAFDWLSGNMYYSKRSKSAENLHSVLMFNVNHPSSQVYQRTVSYFTYHKGFGLNACPYALAVHPARGFLFFSAGDGNVRSIYRNTLNGTRLPMKTFSVDYVHEYRLLTIDYEMDRLYWIHEFAHETKIRHTRLNGSDETMFRISNLKDSRTIQLDHQWMYLSTGTSIWRINKQQQGAAVRIVPRHSCDLVQDVAGVRVMNASLQILTKNSPCTVNNGGCEQFCYAAPVKTCDCMDSENVDSGGSCW